MQPLVQPYGTTRARRERHVVHLGTPRISPAQMAHLAARHRNHERALGARFDAVELRVDRQEYALYDVVNVAHDEGRHPVAIEGEAFETAGVNSRAELAHLELDWQRRRREEALEKGATLIDPESVWFSADTARASLSNRERRSASPASEAGSTLIATSRPSLVSRAR